MARIRFPEFAPDRIKYDPEVTDYVLNVFPKVDSYGPMGQFTALSTALESVPRGAILAVLPTGGYVFFAFTEATAWRLSSVDNDWDEVTNVGGDYSVPASGAFECVQFGSDIIATNGFDEVQKYPLGSDPTLFVDLGGTPPKARHVGVVSDFLVLGGPDDWGLNSVMWSGVNDAETWTVGSKACDYQQFPDGNEVLAVKGFETGAVIIQEGALRLMNSNFSSPLVFDFQAVDKSKIATAPRSVVKAGSDVFFLTRQGFYKFPNIPIGNERVDKFFFNDLDEGYIWQTQGAADPNQNIVFWRYKSVDYNSTEASDRVIIYNYALDKWSLANAELTWICDATTPGVTLEGLANYFSSLDDVTPSLDSRYWRGGTPLIAGFNTSYQLGFFSGLPMEAVLSTNALYLNPGRRAFVNGFTPVTDTAAATGRVGVLANRYGDSVSWKGDAAMQRTGLIPARANARFHRFEVTIPENTEWNHIQGIEVEPTDGGSQ